MVLAGVVVLVGVFRVGARFCVFFDIVVLVLVLVVVVVGVGRRACVFFGIVELILVVVLAVVGRRACGSWCWC